MSYLMQLSFFLKCEESLGMGMIFSVVDAAQQWINENVSPDTSEQHCDNKVNCVCFISYMLLTMHVYSRHSLSTYTLGVGKRRDKWHRTETSQIWRTQTDRRKMAVCHRTCGKPLFYMYMCTYTLFVHIFRIPVCLYWIFTDKMYFYSLTSILYHKFDEKLHFL